MKFRAPFAMTFSIALLAAGCTTAAEGGDAEGPTGTTASAYTTADIDVRVAPRSVTATIYERGEAQLSVSNIAGSPDPVALVDLPCDVSSVGVTATVSYTSAAAGAPPLYALFRTSVREVGFTGFVSHSYDVSPLLSPNTLTSMTPKAPIGPNSVQPASLTPNREYRVETVMAALSVCADRFDSACGYKQLQPSALANDTVAFKVRRVCP
ncbi:MAG: hypothetical protein JNL38_14700 [Myxococcales bacterium]|jgi:hypothetical protein|nr:hypothetical protein [Myxococcales bacterium]